MSIAALLSWVEQILSTQTNGWGVAWSFSRACLICSQLWQSSHLHSLCPYHSRQSISPETCRRVRLAYSLSHLNWEPSFLLYPWSQLDWAAIESEWAVLDSYYSHGMIELLWYRLRMEEKWSTWLWELEPQRCIFTTHTQSAFVTSCSEIL